jgi:hypothetical protein
VVSIKGKHGAKGESFCRFYFLLLDFRSLSPGFQFVLVCLPDFSNSEGRGLALSVALNHWQMA